MNRIGRRTSAVIPVRSNHRSEATEADYCHMGGRQALLTGYVHVGQHDLAAIAQQLLVV